VQCDAARDSAGRRDCKVAPAAPGGVGYTRLWTPSRTESLLTSRAREGRRTGRRGRLAATSIRAPRSTARAIIAEDAQFGPRALCGSAGVRVPRRSGRRHWSKLVQALLRRGGESSGES
jgi:hypothetical protein